MLIKTSLRFYLTPVTIDKINETKKIKQLMLVRMEGNRKT